MANNKNLMPIELVNARRTQEERTESARKAGKASGEARSQKANFKKAIYCLLLRWKRNGRINYRH